jgi:hypothetical protein
MNIHDCIRPNIVPHSTVSGGINSMAGAFLADFVAPIYLEKKGDTIPESLANIISRIMGMAVTMLNNSKLTITYVLIMIMLFFVSLLMPLLKGKIIND